MFETTKELKTEITNYLHLEDVQTESDNYLPSGREARVILPNEHFPKMNLKYKKIAWGKSCPYNWFHPASPEIWEQDEGDEIMRRYRRQFRHYAHFLRCLDCYQIQPVEIPFRDRSGKQLKYRPLALLTFSRRLQFCSMKPVLIDVRSRDDIEKNWEWFYPAWRAANRFARRNGWNFCLIRDEFFHTPLYRNASFLLRYRNYPINDDYLVRLNTEIYYLKTITVHQLLKNVSRDSAEYAAMIPQLWRMLDAAYGFFDLKQPLTMNTEIYFI